MEYSTKISERMWNLPDKGELEAQREQSFIDDIIQKAHIEKELINNLQGIKTAFDGGAGSGDLIDDDIAALEAKIEQIDADMMKFATDSGKLNDLMKEKDANESALEEKMDRWVYLNDLAERIEAQKQGGK